MKKKSLILSILGAALSIALICVGVYAISYMKLNIVGTLNFISYDKSIYVEKVEIKNFVESPDGGVTYLTKNKELAEFAGRYLGESEQTTSIDISDLQIIEGEELLIEITFKSLNTEMELDVFCDYTETREK